MRSDVSPVVSLLSSSLVLSMVVMEVARQDGEMEVLDVVLTSPFNGNLTLVSHGENILNICSSALFNSSYTQYDLILKQVNILI